MKQGFRNLILFTMVSSFFSAGGTALAGSGRAIRDGSIQPPPGLPGAGPQTYYSLPGAGPQADYGLLSAELQISPASSEGDRFSADIAYNSIDDEYLVVWHNLWGGGFRDIYARRVTSDAQLEPWFCIVTGAGGDELNRLQPAVAFNPQRREYLVVYMVETSSLQYEIRGRIIPSNGPGTNAEFPISGTGSFWSPKVAYNPTRNEYLVAYSQYDIAGGVPGTPYRILGAIVKFDGIIPSRYTWIDTGSPDQVDLAYNSSKNGYVLAYVKSHPAITKNDIDLIHLGSSGDLLIPPGVIHISATADDENRPAVATDQMETYTVAWDAESNPPLHTAFIKSILWATDYSYSGGGFGPPDAINSDVSFDASGNSLWVYQVDFSPGISILSWFRGGGADLFPAFSSDNRACEAPSVLGGVRSFLVAYECDPSDANRHIYARLFVPPAVYLPVVRR